MLKNISLFALDVLIQTRNLYASGCASMAQGDTTHLPSVRPLPNMQNLHFSVYKEQPDNFHLHDRTAD